MYQLLVKAAFVAAFIFTGLSFLGASTAEALVARGRSCSEPDCTTQTPVQGLNLHCRACTVQDTGTKGKPSYTRTSCRPGNATTPPDGELDSTAGDLAMRACENAPLRNDAMISVPVDR